MSIFAARALAAPDSPSAAVDVFIGTGGDGHCHPGATRPFGMVQLGPDTAHRSHRESYPWCAGYRYEDESILGFSHTHFSGTGHGDLGDVLLMPFTGATRLEPGYPERAMSGYRSRFSHELERGEPGYYAVRLLDHEIDVELTASERVGLHRYHYGSGIAGKLLLDLRTSLYDHKDKNQWARLRLRGDRLVTGMRQTRGWAPGRQLHFAIEFSQPLLRSELHNTEDGIAYRGFRTPGRAPQDKRVLEGTKLLGVFEFGAELPQGQLLVKVAISTVSEDQAIANLAEMPGWDFDAERRAAAAAWDEALGVLEIEADEAMRRNLYTAQYHALQAPSLFMDLDGQYRGPDNQVHRAEGFRYHSTFSLWDTYRALHPWLLLCQSEQRNSDFIQSLLVSQAHSPHGILPVWQFHGLETWCMIGYHALPVIADAWLKGVRGFDPQRALQAMRASAEYAPYGGIGDYLQYGYVPFDLEGEGASKTLEYSFDDWTLARMAESLGEAETAATYYRRAQSFRHLLDPQTGFVRGKSSAGEFRLPFDPTAAGYGSDYTEGSAWQYSWYVPHDGAALVANLGGDAGLVKRLDEIFEAETNAKMYSHMEDIAGLIGHYAHGNEPSHHIAYLYAFAGAPWKTQARLAQIVPSQYKNGAAGLAGNDDLGQMSAWLLFSALGFYPVAPGSNEYVIGRPFVRAARLRLPNGRVFSVRAENYAEENVYVGRVTLNGREHHSSVLAHEALAAGAELVFHMQAEPNKDWGAAPAQRPYTQTPYR
ncbi:MAG: GH92 family glycosyl hydrolase [Roseateles asaccharophilus]|uniref:Putative alpha-1,2-mannosidase n=1 Tax=Roseateles asaccharophilus TaxID=582607 RepID=A0A4R6MYR0_9BURK|nr:GH92 family glycosyl hydrolase [Roseateles asaccharophilus]MDN3545394.1 GH92 family glycosyl hydrolase [Roseateles asaccharophilus]TDP07774.1 putative alpha-1,2-mannosidase [Roseateles asaccharophilus]